MCVLALVATILLASSRIDAETHRFTPTSFYNTYSFAHPPALRIKPGDRVVTKTTDAAGVDATGKSVASGPNPQTGPFYVEGAEPGDMLVVTIEKLDTNRAMAYSGSLLSPYTVDPGAIAARAGHEVAVSTGDQGAASRQLDQVSYSPAGSNCHRRSSAASAAPARKEAISSGAGRVQRNMDYALMGAGVKLMPVNSGRRIPRRRSRPAGKAKWPAPDSDVAGYRSASSREEEGDRMATDRNRDARDGPRQRARCSAFQHATSELQRWLMADYGLTERGAQTLMGQAAEYEIANVVDPNFTVVAKIRKAMVPRR
jgi:hypothetical protein